MITCPRCGHENDDQATSCANCRINLHWAFENLSDDLVTAPLPDDQGDRTEPRRRPKTQGEKARDLLLGFAGWLVVSSFLALVGGDIEGAPLAGLCLTPLGILALVGLAFKWRWVALGWLVAYALNLVVALAVNQMLGAAPCGVPFFASDL